MAYGFRKDVSTVWKKSVCANKEGSSACAKIRSEDGGTSEVQQEWLSAPESRRAIESLHLTRIAEPEDIARFILYLAQDVYLTGGIYLLMADLPLLKQR
ncbi:hypothetical protein GXP70_02335 [Paenibacillus lycopersici]|uniref:Uncharacterized protein n=1 Tax=Paenibacillus lycopersici TaxID=2704462 RepID=A0A6C0FUC4_9BACL|nr:hypothetical protein [Paenibacillus lycopersici]QHT58924.1 hypothetical protein GXP70_02335 [Paenibacillus lycopersici]